MSLHHVESERGDKHRHVRGRNRGSSPDGFSLDRQQAGAPLRACVVHSRFAGPVARRDARLGGDDPARRGEERFGRRDVRQPRRRRLQLPARLAEPRRARRDRREARRDGRDRRLGRRRARGRARRRRARRVRPDSPRRGHRRQVRRRRPRADAPAQDGRRRRFRARRGAKGNCASCRRSTCPTAG